MRSWLLDDLKASPVAEEVIARVALCVSRWRARSRHGARSQLTREKGQVLGLWQQARARAPNTEARLFILVDCPSAGSWVECVQQVPPAAAFATGIAVQSSCRAGEMSWSGGGGAAEGGLFTSWYTQAEAHGHSPWSLEAASLPAAAAAPLPYPGQVISAHGVDRKLRREGVSGARVRCQREESGDVSPDSSGVRHSLLQGLSLVDSCVYDARVCGGGGGRGCICLQH